MCCKFWLAWHIHRRGRLRELAKDLWIFAFAPPVDVYFSRERGDTVVLHHSRVRGRSFFFGKWCFACVHRRSRPRVIWIKKERDKERESWSYIDCDPTRLRRGEKREQEYSSNLRSGFKTGARCLPPNDSVRKRESEATHVTPRHHTLQIPFALISFC